MEITEVRTDQPAPGQETYLGDGLYASYDGHQIVLWAERDGRRHTVYLEGPVFIALLRFAASLSTSGMPSWRALLRKYLGGEA